MMVDWASLRSAVRPRMDPSHWIPLRNHEPTYDGKTQMARLGLMADISRLVRERPVVPCTLKTRKSSAGS
jgi:hypothetical protein